MLFVTRHSDVASPIRKRQYRFPFNSVLRRRRRRSTTVLRRPSSYRIRRRAEGHSPMDAVRCRSMPRRRRVVALHRGCSRINSDSMNRYNRIVRTAIQSFLTN